MNDIKPPSLEQPSAFSLWLNVWPFLHVASGLAIAFGLCVSVAQQLSLLLAWIYLLPPLLARILISCFGRPEGKLTQDMRAYRVWWALTQLQTIFNRLPALEELLRLVPGLYALWIRLWGGQLSPQAYVGPRMIISDRYAVRVEPGAVLGMKSILIGHFVSRDENGRWVILVAAPTVEREAILGADAKLGPGATLSAGEMLPAGHHVPAFGVWPRRKTNTPSST